MLFKEEKAFELDYKFLEECQKNLIDEMNNLNDWFSGGTL
jgi:hypothetical protein